MLTGRTMAATIGGTFPRTFVFLGIAAYSCSRTGGRSYKSEHPAAAGDRLRRERELPLHLFGDAVLAGACRAGPRPACRGPSRTGTSSSRTATASPTHCRTPEPLSTRQHGCLGKLPGSQSRRTPALLHQPANRHLRRAGPPGVTAAGPSRRLRLGAAGEPRVPPRWPDSVSGDQTPTFFEDEAGRELMSYFTSFRSGNWDHDESVGGEDGAFGSAMPIAELTAVRPTRGLPSDVTVWKSSCCRTVRAGPDPASLDFWSATRSSTAADPWLDAGSRSQPGQSRLGSGSDCAVVRRP